MSKRSHSQIVKKEYLTQWPDLARSSKGLHHVFCQVCNSDFSIAHGGKNDCLRHIEGARHRQNADASSSNRNIKTLFASKENTDMGTIKAETLFAKFLVEHNLPLSAADHAGPLFRRMFPDSKIANKYRCARTKSTEIIKSFAKTTKENLFSSLRSKKFAIATDGSNSVTNEKLYPIVVTYFEETIGRIETTLLSLPKLEKDGTGENIFLLLKEELQNHDVPWTNCVAFSADNASVMLGEHKGVGSFIKKENPNIVVHGCACHLVHLAAQHGTKKMTDFNVEDFLVDVYYYLKKSTKRIQLLKVCEEACELEHRKILKYGATRWLSMGKVIDRFLEQWEALKNFFCEEEKGTSSSFFKLKKTFGCPSTKLYLLFLQSVIPLFQDTNVMMQMEAPLIYKYKREMANLFKAILSRFIKPKTIMESTSVFEINFSKKKNQKEDTELVIGGKARQYIKDETLPAEELEKFYSSVRSFYAEACSYMAKKFPLRNDIYEHSQVADLSIRHEVNFSSVQFFLDLFYIPEGERDGIEVDFSTYQIDPLNDEILSAPRCDVAWSRISELKDSSGEIKYKCLPSLMQMILLLPHSNAACERVFSIVKKNLTDFRSSMNLVTLEAILIEKCKNFGTSCYDTVLSEADLNRAKQATYLAQNEKKKKNRQLVICIRL